jgi:Arc/MetJ family transcription regulator
MAKRLVDIDDELLANAQDELGTATIKATVNEALRRVGARRSATIQQALDDLAMMPAFDRADAWR